MRKLFVVSVEETDEVKISPEDMDLLKKRAYSTGRTVNAVVSDAIVNMLHPKDLEKIPENIETGYKVLYSFHIGTKTLADIKEIAKHQSMRFGERHSVAMMLREGATLVIKKYLNKLDVKNTVYDTSID